MQVNVLLLTPAPLSQEKNEVLVELEVGYYPRVWEVLENSLLPFPGFATHIALGRTEDKHVKPVRNYFVPSCSGLYTELEY